jgi:two-component system chemotaxis response regulator CheB
VILALEAGAFDFVLKPPARCTPENTAPLQRLLVQKIRCFSIRRYSRIAKSFSLAQTPRDAQPTAEDLGSQAQAAVQRKLAQPGARKEGQIEAVVIGVSTGGPEALSEVIPELPASFPVPIVIVLHMPKHFTGRMAEALDREADLAVKEATDGDILQPGQVYLAPGGRHLILDRETRGRIALRTVDDPPENGCKPSVDVLFRSAAKVLRGSVLAVVLTGMGEDGTKGLRELKQHQARVLVQDEATSVVWGMPGSAVRAGCADEILPLGKIARRISELC